MKAANLKNCENIAGYKISRENNSQTIFSAESLMQRKYLTALFTETALFHALSAVMQAKNPLSSRWKGSIYVTLFSCPVLSFRATLRKLFPVFCCHGRQGRTWINTWKRWPGQIFLSFNAMSAKITKNYYA